MNARDARIAEMIGSTSRVAVRTARKKLAEGHGYIGTVEYWKGIMDGLLHDKAARTAFGLDDTVELELAEVRNEETWERTILVFAKNLRGIFVPRSAKRYRRKTVKVAACS